MKKSMELFNGKMIEHDFEQDAETLLSLWFGLTDEDRKIDYEEGFFSPEGMLAFTVYDDFSVSLGHWPDGLHGQSEPNAEALAQAIENTAYVVGSEEGDEND